MPLANEGTVLRRVQKIKPAEVKRFAERKALLASILKSIDEDLKHLTPDNRESFLSLMYLEMITLLAGYSITIDDVACWAKTARMDPADREGIEREMNASTIRAQQLFETVRALRT